MIPGFDVEWSVFQHVLVSLGLGAIVGLERQTHQMDDDRVRNGIRTFALASLLGTVCALLYGWFPAVATAIAGAVAIATAVRHPQRVASLFLIDPVVPVDGWPQRILPMLDAAVTYLQPAASAAGSHSPSSSSGTSGRMAPCRPAWPHSSTKRRYPIRNGTLA